VDGSARELLEAISTLLARGERGALATVVRTGGSAPQVTGARMLIDAHGKSWGTVGGGRIEEAVREELTRCLRGATARTLHWELTQDLGMCCGGRMEVFVEPIQGSPRLIMFGAGHVAEATARLAVRLDFRVTVVDERAELNTEGRFPACTRLDFAPDEALSELALSEHDFLLVVTHDHALDQEILERALRLPHRYIGMIGSERKVRRIFARIAERRGELALSRVYAPVGLDLGAIGPEEIAVSVMAELIALRRGKAAQHMRVSEPS
jgi:xanthine dehydrogenase accessory factor